MALCKKCFFFIIGENAIVIVSGANMKLTVDDVLEAEYIVKDAKVLVCQLEIEPAVTLAALRMAKRLNGN